MADDTPLVDDDQPKAKPRRKRETRAEQAEAAKVVRDAEQEACLLAANENRRKWFKILDDFTGKRLQAIGTHEDAGREDISRVGNPLVMLAQDKALIAAFQAIEHFCDDLRPNTPPMFPFDISRAGKDQ